MAREMGQPSQPHMWRLASPWAAHVEVVSGASSPQLRSYKGSVLRWGATQTDAR